MIQILFKVMTHYNLFNILFISIFFYSVKFETDKNLNFEANYEIKT